VETDVEEMVDLYTYVGTYLCTLCKKQGDQIGRILAHWANLRKLQKMPKLWATFSTKKLFPNFDKNGH
jgi:Ran GTPase-activating protein (RanGAP) involved in mRNA processing and transport